MSKVRIEITSENKKLIKSLLIKSDDNGNSYIDISNPYGGGFIRDEIANILGYGSDYIENSDNFNTGKEFNKDIEEIITKTHNSLIPVDGFDEILSLIIQFSVDGGLTEGVYECIDYEKIWKKVN